MNKRNILSLFLVGSLLGGLSVTFTGCIDNDEPEGIKVLREAKAGLLNAKTVLAAADAAKVQADAQLVLAQAEVEKAKAAAINLLAEAEAAKTQAQADSIRAQIEVITAQAQEALYKAEEARVTLEKNTYEAEIAMKTALLEFETGPKQDYLQYFYKNYQAALAEYNTVYEDYIAASKNYLNDLADTKLVRYDTEYNLTKALESAENALATNQATIANLESAIAEAANLQPSDLEAKKDSITAILDSFDLQKANIELARAEAENANHEVLEAEAQLSTALSTAEYTYVDIDPFTYTFPEVTVVSGYTGEYTINQNLSFRVDRYGNVNGNYNYALNNLKNVEARVKRALLDDDDLAWNDATIEQYTRQLASLEETYEADKESWQEAVDFYNGGKGYDLSKLTLSGYTEFKAAIDAYNALVEPANKAKKALEDAQAAENTAEDAWKAANPDNENIKSALEIRTAAYAAADKVRAEAYAAAADAKEAAIKAKKDALVDAQNDVKVKEDLYNAAVANDAAATSTATVSAVNKALENLTAASKKVTEAEEAAEKAATDAEADKQKAQHQADYVWYTAYADADQAYKDAVASGYDASLDANYTAAYNAYVAAQKATSAASDAYNGYVDKKGDFVPGALSNLNKAYGEVFNAFWDMYWATEAKLTTYELRSYDETITDEEGNEQTITTSYWHRNTSYYTTIWEHDIANYDSETEQYIALDIEKFVSSSDEDAKRLVRGRSQTVYGYASQAYGSTYGDQLSDKSYNLPYERITELTKDQIDEIIKTHAGVPDYEVYLQYRYFGSYGQLLYEQAAIDVLKARKDNPTIVEEVTAQIDAAIEALNQQVADQQAVVNQAYADYLAQVQIVNELEAEFDAQIAAINVQVPGLTKIKDALLNVISLDGSYLSQADIDSYVKDLKASLSAAKNQTESLEHQAERAQKALEAWQTEGANQADADAALVELHEAELQNLQDQVDAAKAALDAAIAYLETLE